MRKHPPIVPKGHIRKFDKHKARIEKVFDCFSDHELDILNSRGVKVEVHKERVRTRERNFVGYYNPVKKIAGVSIGRPDWNGMTAHLMRLHFNVEFITAHELMHGVLDYDVYDLLSADVQEKFFAAAEQARENVRKVAPEEMKQIERAIDASLAGNSNLLEKLSFLPMSDEKKLAIQLGTWLNPKLYQIYAKDSPKYPDEKRLPEMICNLKGMMHVYGREKVEALAGKFMHEADALVADIAVEKPRAFTEKIVKPQSFIGKVTQILGHGWIPGH